MLEWLTGITVSFGMIAALAYGVTMQQLLLVLLAGVLFCFSGKEEVREKWESEDRMIQEEEL